MILLIGITEDPTLTYFMRYLKQYNNSFYFLNQAEYGSKINIDADNIYDNDRCLPLEKFSGIYNRATGLDPSENHSHYKHAQMTLIYYLLSLPQYRTANPSTSCNSNFSKPYQLNLLINKHLKIPDSCIMANTYPIKFGDKMIYKSVSSVRSIVKPFIENDLKRAITCPVLLQKLIQGENIRAHVVNQEVFALQINANEVDYRYTSGNIQFTSISLPKKIRQACIDITEQLSLVVSGIDLIKTKNDYFILEVNTSPGYSFFEQKMPEQSISKALIDYFSGEAT